MNQLKKTYLTVVILLITSCLLHAQSIKISWDYARDYDGKNNLDVTIKIKNEGNEALNLSNQGLWFNSMYPIIDKNNEQFKIFNKNGNLYLITFKQGTEVKSRDSLLLTYKSPYRITHYSIVPNGFYLQDLNDDKKIINIGAPEIPALNVSPALQSKILSTLYDKNVRVQGGTAPLILPTPTSITKHKGFFKISGNIKVYRDNEFESEVNHLKSLFSNIKGANWKEVEKAEANIKLLKKESLSDEEYEMQINKSGIIISANNAAGVFYAIQSIRSILTANQIEGKEVAKLPFIEVKDKPRYGYRGFMLDISRNYNGLDVLKKYIDFMATQKLNMFHLHFIDDEGWRLEIPSLPELTEIGSVRSAQFKDGNNLQPAYGSGPDATNGQYLSKKDFQELLLYAAERHVSIIPEIETPGHARAAIKAMETRFKRLMKEGKQQEAKEFLLYEAEDKSVYSSAQYWNDNVMNPALPSVYRFIDVVISDIQKMYSEVGLSLKRISLGGDEVPSGSWEKSPAVADLMKKEGMKTVYEVWPYYVQKIHEICESKGLEMAGWEEFGMINKGKGMVVNEGLNHKNMQLDVWNNVVGGGNEDLAYRLANSGYKVVIISSSNYYFDMVWDHDFREPGLNWASITDLYHAFSFMPEHFLNNIQYSEKGEKLSKEYISSKVKLNEVGKSNIEGIKAALFAETIVSSDRVDYMLLPRLFALSERAWSSPKSWESDQEFSLDAFNSYYANFIQKLGYNELPKLNYLANGFNYRLPSVGLRILNGKLTANTEYPGFNIHYTVGDQTVAAKSKLFPKGGMKFKQGTKVNLAVVNQQGRVGRVSSIVIE